MHAAEREREPSYRTRRDVTVNTTPGRIDRANRGREDGARILNAVSKVSDTVIVVGSISARKRRSNYFLPSSKFVSTTSLVLTRFCILILSCSRHEISTSEHETNEDA